MDNPISITLSPVQALLTLAFQVWIIVFPIIIIKKLNFLTEILQEHFDTDRESS